MLNHHHEFELMCLCARVVVDPSAETRIAVLLESDVDWDFIISAGHAHRVLPLLHRTLKRVAAESVPAQPMHRIQIAAHEKARRSLLLTRELVRILDLFHAHEIPCIPYKGPVLASRVYRDMALRDFSDLDIIVPQDNVLRARALLLADGYRQDRDTTEAQLRENLDSNMDLSMFRADLAVEVELHWRVTRHWHAIQIPLQTLWEQLDTCSLAGRSVQTHTFEDLLVILCTHAAMHSWDRLGWLCDVAEIVRSQKLDWDRTFDRAAAVDGRRILLVGLALASELLGTALPSPVHRAIRLDRQVKPLVDQVTAWLSSDATRPLGERERLLIRLRERPADRMRVGFEQIKRRMAPTSRDAQSFPLLRSSNVAQHLLRPIRLAREYGLMPLMRFFRGIFQS